MEIEVSLLHDVAHRVSEIKQEIKKALKNFVHPITGKLYSNHYLCDSPLYATELFCVIQKIEGVDGIEFMKINGSPVESKVDVPKNHMVWFANIDVIVKEG